MTELKILAGVFVIDSGGQRATMVVQEPTSGRVTIEDVEEENDFLNPVVFLSDRPKALNVSMRIHPEDPGYYKRTGQGQDMLVLLTGEDAMGQAMGIVQEVLDRD